MVMSEEGLFGDRFDATVYIVCSPFSPNSNGLCAWRRWAAGIGARQQLAFWKLTDALTPADTVRPSGQNT